MKIHVETTVRAPLDRVWEAYSNPDDIVRWNAASDDWHTTRAAVDLREGGRFLSRMEARDGSAGFDFEGEYTRVEPQRAIDYRMPDGREVQVEFIEHGDVVQVHVAFDPENVYPHEYQRQGWQAILDSFARHVAAGLPARG